MTARIELRLRGQLDHLRIAWQAAETLLAEVPFEAGPEDPKGARYNVLLALQELLTNVLRHGYGVDAGYGDAADRVDPVSRMDAGNGIDAGNGVIVELDLAGDQQGFCFELRDRAPAFDPAGQGLDARRAETPEGMPPQEGGYGLVIVRAVMDEFHYERRDGWNMVRAVKHVAPVPVGGGSR